MLTWLTVAGMIGWTWWGAQRTCRALRRDPQDRDGALRHYERMRWRYQIALFATYIVMMCLFGWGWAVGRFWLLGETVLPGAEVLILAPFLTAMLLSWVCFYDADRAAYVVTHSLSSDPLVERPARS